MAVLSTNEEMASRFAPYLKELHELFTLHGVIFGTPAALPELVARLESSDSFADDVSSILRSIILREGGNVPQSELLEVIALAAAGPSLDPALPEVQPAFRRLLVFVGNTVRRAWNIPPGAEPARGTVEPRPGKLPENAAWHVAPEQGAVRGNGSITLPPGFRPFAPHEKTPEQPAKPGQTPPAKRHSRRNPARALWTAAACVVAALLVLIFFARKNSPANVPPPVVSTAASSPAGTASGPGRGLPAQPDKPSAATPLPAGRQAVVVAQRALPSTSYAGPPVTQPTAGSATSPSPIQQGDTPPAALSTSHSSAPVTAANSGPGEASLPLAAAPGAGGGSEIRKAPASALPRARSGRGAYFQVSSGVMASHLVRSADPGYPILARVAHVQGQVILQAVISTAGEVVATHVLSGHHLLRGAASSAVKKWRYKPFLVDGRAVNVATIVTVEFHEQR